MSIEFKCPSCGKKLFSYEARVRKYGSLIKECRKCGSDYIDPRYYELAINGVPEDEYKVSPYLFMIVIGGLIIWRALRLFGMRQLGVASEIQWLLPSLLLIMGIVFVIGAIVSIILIKTGLRKKKMDRLLAQSQARLKDSSYVSRLRTLGYKLDDRFGGLGY